MRTRGEFVNRQGFAEMLKGPLHGSRDRAVIDFSWDRRFDELRLAAVAMRGNDHLPGDGVSGLGAVIVPH